MPCLSFPLERMTKKKRIILVEDDYTYLNLIANYLTKEGYEVAAYCHGEIAMDSYNNQAADLVITDIFLPDIDGIDLIRVLKQINPEVKIISMSAQDATANVDHLAISLSLGCSHALRKPLNFPDLAKLITQVI